MPLGRLLLVSSLLLRALPAGAQQVDDPWFLRVFGGHTAFGNAASTDAPTPDETAAIGVGSGFRYGAAVGRRVGPVELALAGQTGGHALEARDEVDVGVRPAYDLHLVSLTVAYPLVRFASGARLQLFAGPSLAIWSGDLADETRTRLGGLGGVGVVAPLNAWLALDMHASLGVVGSPITEENLATLDSDYDARTGWSRELAVGLRLAF
jgi:hypothetical protein